VRRILFAFVASVAVVCTSYPLAAPHAGTRLEVPAGIATGLRQAGFPVQKRCGFVDGPGVAACWLNIERSGYSVHVVPHRSLREAKVVYRRLSNPWAKATRVAMFGKLIVSGFRVPLGDWQRIVAVVERSVR
jgi:hypothetical protein